MMEAGLLKLFQFCRPRSVRHRKAVEVEGREAEDTSDGDNYSDDMAPLPDSPRKGKRKVGQVLGFIGQCHSWSVTQMNAQSGSAVGAGASFCWKQSASAIRFVTLQMLPTQRLGSCSRWPVIQEERQMFSNFGTLNPCLFICFLFIEHCGIYCFMQLTGNRQN